MSFVDIIYPRMDVENYGTASRELEVLGIAYEECYELRTSCFYHIPTSKPFINSSDLASMTHIRVPILDQEALLS